MAFRVTSSAFNDGGNIPRPFTCDGKDEPPPLTLSDVPQGTRSLALIVDDPDAPRGAFNHWLAYDIPPGSANLGATAGKSLRNGFGRERYGGPCPPPGHGPHRYQFTVYALDVPSLSLRGHSRKDLEDALADHVLGTARLMGKYERSR